MEFPAVALSLLVALRMSPLAAGSELQPHMPNVCAEQELGVVALRQPCVQALSRAARVWKQDCGGRRWCAGYEPRVVYYTGYRQVYQLRSQTTYRCCPGWSQLAGDAGCLHTLQTVSSAVLHSNKLKMEPYLSLYKVS
ncbi:multiple epidermal growth factor-like domains protein 6 [Passer domesticus]|uniref:multiple epidermal growth factor-like domains protein 6 n=1 Tax=Passer domesticus TaxID=48849 RepID=UPI0030FEB27C